MADIFKSYDVRGIYPIEVNEDLAYRIGRGAVVFLNARTVAVGLDNRVSSPALCDALIRGITDAGANVIQVGMLSTPMLYFASSRLSTDAAIMVTASHNPGQYNGFKICKTNAQAMGLANGLSNIRDLAEKNEWQTPTHAGTITNRDIKKEYDDYVLSFADLQGKLFTVATDTAHAMGVLELPILHQLKGVSLSATLYDTLQKPGVCPHEANPIKEETLYELRHVVRKTKADIGIAYDGDADRIGFIDEKGIVVPMDLVTALLAQEMLRLKPGATILYDLRSSKAVKEKIEALGGIAHESKVGHANIKKQMLDAHALLAGEASGHYYFALAGYTAEMGTLPAIFLLNLMARTGKKLSTLVAEIKKYAHSGEINLHVRDATLLMEKVKTDYTDGTLSTLDGIKITYPDWWFSLRSSNTEPLLRLNIEANTPDLLETKKAELLTLLTT